MKYLVALAYIVPVTLLVMFFIFRPSKRHDKPANNSKQVNRNVDELIVSARKHGKTIAQRKALHRAAASTSEPRYSEDGTLLTPLLVAAAIINANEIPDCAPVQSSDNSTDSSSYDSGSGSCDSGGSDFSGGN